MPRNTSSNPTQSPSSNALILQRNGFYKSAIELTPHSLRLGPVILDTHIARQRLGYIITALFLLKQFAQTQAAPARDGNPEVVAYYSDPTGETNYQYISYSRQEDYEEVPNQIVSNCNASTTAFINATLFETIKTVGHVAAQLGRGVNQESQAEFEQCSGDELQKTYDYLSKADSQFVLIASATVGSAFGCIALIIVCIAVIGIGSCVIPELRKKSQETGKNTQNDGPNVIEINGIATDINLEDNSANTVVSEIGTDDIETGEVELDEGQRCGIM